MIEVPDELLSFLKAEYDRCQDSTLEEERETAIDRYNGQPYGDEEEGYSQVVARDTAETVDYMTISVLRTIISGERVVEFVHRDSEKAHEATETIMHLLMDEQDGYQILHDWLKAGLLEKNALAMTYGEPQPKKRTVHEGVSQMALVAAQEQGHEIIEAEEAGEGDDGPMFNIAVMQAQAPKFCDAAVPNEEFYCSPDARSITDAPLKGRRVRKSLSDLIAMGLPRDEVEAISSDSHYNDAISNSRNDQRYNDESAREGLSRRVWWHEDYATFDLNDDGIAELLYIRRSADWKIFSIEEMGDPEDHPFVDWCPFPMQHRRVGQSLFDKVGDLERINTVLLRQTLNGIYQSNNPSTYLHEDSIGENTIDDLLTVRPGRMVRWKGAQPPVERQGAFDPSVGFSAMEFIDRRRETRTGITRLNMGLDEDTLNQTAKGQAQLIARGEQVEEYVARNFGNALAKLITKKARVLQRYGQPIMVPIDGEYREVDPRAWPEDMIARARVGLGASRKDQRIAFRRELAQMQMVALQSGLPIVDPQRFFNSAKGFVNDAGLGDVTEFFVEPPKGPDGQPLPEQPKPNPEMMKVQAEAQAAQAKMQLAQQEAQLKAQMRQQEHAAEMQFMREKAAADLELTRQKAAAEVGMNRERMAGEFQLERERMAMQAEVDAMRAANDHDAAIDANRAGGDLDK